MAKDLKQKAMDGIFWSALQRYSKMLIGFVSGIILARLLTPYDYGLIGMLAIFMVLAESFIDSGFGTALIQKKRPTQTDYSTIFFWNLGMAVVMYAILFAAAPAIARFYGIPLLSKVLRVQGLVLFIYAMNIIQRNQLKKQLNFKLLALVSVGTALIALIITVWLAYRGYGVWALVVQHLVVAAIPSLVFWFYVKWRPSLVFSVQSFKELFSFGFYMFLTHLFNHFSSQIHGLLIGKIYNPSTMGYYTKAADTEYLAATSISKVMTQVTYPLYSEVQDDPPALQNMVKRLTTSIAFVTFPMMFLLLLCAKPIFILLYSERWMASIPYFQVLCLAGLASCLHSAQLQSVAAIGKSKVMFLGMVIKRCVGLTVIIGGLFFFGMKGFMAGWVIDQWFSYFYNAHLVSKYVGYRFKRQVRDLAPVVCVSVLALGIAFLAIHFLGLPLYVDGVLKALVFLAVYLGWAFLVKPESYTFTKSVILPFAKKILRRGGSHKPAGPEGFFQKHPEAYADCDPAELKRIKKKMYEAKERYGLAYLDFWRCRCERKVWTEVRDIVPYTEMTDLWKKFNPPAARELLNDKWAAYQRFGEFYRREVLLVQGEADAAQCAAFAARHARFVMKPLGQWCGRGIEILTADGLTARLNDLFTAYPDGFLLEELIVQDEALGQFHPTSVNTLRINTFNGPNGPEVLWPCLRMGRGGNVVDNAGAGGIFGAVDVATGKIIAASNEFHSWFDVHPDTGVPIVGFQIPHWEEACAVARQLAERLPEAGFVGWDLALTAEGWVMVEGNANPLLIWQIATTQGIRHDFERIKREKLG